MTLSDKLLKNILLKDTRELFTQTIAVSSTQMQEKVILKRQTAATVRCLNGNKSI